MSMKDIVFEHTLRSRRYAQSEWAPERRRLYLLRQDVELPLSIDRYVLPHALPDEPASDTLELLAVVVSTPASQETVEQWSPFDTGHAVPEDSDLARHHLGYDICDQSKISALMNCGYEPGEREQLGDQWSARLNEHHLFESLADADEFRALSDGRVREHAPFVVVRLYRRAEPTG